MMTGAEGGRPKRSGNTVWSTVFGQVEPELGSRGTSGKPKIQRVRNAGEGFVCGPVQSSDGLDHRRVSTRGIRICPDATSIREPRARPFAQVFRTPSSRERAQRRPAAPGRTKNGGDDACLKLGARARTGCLTIEYAMAAPYRRRSASTIASANTWAPSTMSASDVFSVQ